MKSFPQYIRVNNKKKFDSILNDKISYNIREKLVNFILNRNNDEKIYFELDYYKQNYNENEINKIIIKIMKELELLGWNCKLSYGQTALFIYSTDDPPSNCYDDEF